MSLTLVPEGATITRRCYTVPQDYTSGAEFEVSTQGWLDACRAANARSDKAYAEIMASSHGFITEAQAEQSAKVRAVVDLRWTLSSPTGGSLDTVIERTNVRHLAGR